MPIAEMTEVLATVRAYSARVEHVFRQQGAQTRTPGARLCLQRAADRERRLQTAVDQRALRLSRRVRHVLFRSHNPQPLFAAVEGLEVEPEVGLEQVTDLVTRCNCALLSYYECLLVCTSSLEVREFVESLRAAREQELKQHVWQAGRSSQ